MILTVSIGMNWSYWTQHEVNIYVWIYGTTVFESTCFIHVPVMNSRWYMEVTHGSHIILWRSHIRLQLYPQNCTIQQVTVNFKSHSENLSVYLESKYKEKAWNSTSKGYYWLLDSMHGMSCFKIFHFCDSFVNVLIHCIWFIAYEMIDRSFDMSHNVWINTEFSLFLFM